MYDSAISRRLNTRAVGALSLVASFALLALSACVAAPPPPATEVQAATIVAPEPPIDELIANEKSKWDAMKTGDLSGFARMLAPDFVSVQYAPDGALSRVDMAAIAQLPPLPPAEFATGDYQVVQAAPDAVVLSYRVTGLNVPFDAYATTVWALRDGQWLSVFYQASPFPPAAGDSAAAGTEAAGSLQAPTQLEGRYLSVRPTTPSMRDAMLFHADGTYAVDALATGEYGGTGRYEINGDTITFTDTTDEQRTDVPSCKGDQRSGNYKITFADNGFKLENVDDKCLVRFPNLDNREWTLQQ